MEQNACGEMAARPKDRAAKWSCGGMAARRNGHAARKMWQHSGHHVIEFVIYGFLNFSIFSK